MRHLLTIIPALICALPASAEELRFASPAREYVMVADYPSTDEAARRRLNAIFQKHHIDFSPLTLSSAVSIFVLSSQAAGARRLVSELVAKEKLSINLYR